MAVLAWAFLIESDFVGVYGACLGYVRANHGMSSLVSVVVLLK